MQERSLLIWRHLKQDNESSVRLATENTTRTDFLIILFSNLILIR
jgi:hypothetical protein